MSTLTSPLNLLIEFLVLLVEVLEDTIGCLLEILELLLLGDYSYVNFYHYLTEDYS